MSSHSCSMRLTRSALASSPVGSSIISRNARQPSTVFFPWASKWAKKDVSCGSSLMAGVYSRPRPAIIAHRSQEPIEARCVRAAHHEAIARRGHPEALLALADDRVPRSDASGHHAGGGGDGGGASTAVDAGIHVVAIARLDDGDLVVCRNRAELVHAAAR